MQRFLKVVMNINDYEGGEIKTSNGNSWFDARCSCALACGYVPCGSALQLAPKIDSNSNLDNVLSDVDSITQFLFIQCFYDPEGKATLICGKCAKCETCSISPEEDVYCSKFEDVCYKED